MIRVMGACDPDQSVASGRVLSGTGAELGGLEDGYGLAVEVEDTIPGEAGEGAREGLARDASRLGHLLAREGGLEDDPPLGDPSLLGGEVEEHTGHPLGGAVEDEIPDEVLQLAGPGSQGSCEADGALGEATHDLQEILAEDGVEHAVGECSGP